MLARKEIPRFRNEDEEREFWASHDSADYVDWSRARRVALPNLKPSTRTISIRLPESMIDELKLLANKRDVPYQSLMKMFLVERIEKELHSSSFARDREPAAGEIREYSGRFDVRLPKNLHRRLVQYSEAEGASLNQLAVVFLAEGIGRVTAAEEPEAGVAIGDQSFMAPRPEPEWLDDAGEQSKTGHGPPIFAPFVDSSDDSAAAIVH